MPWQIGIRLTSFVWVTVLAAFVASQEAAVESPTEVVPAGLKVMSLQTEPSEITLQSPFAYAQIIVSGRLDSGETIDLTRQADFKIEADLATVSNVGLVRPSENGQTTLTVQWGEFESQIPVKVSGQSER